MLYSIEICRNINCTEGEKKVWQLTKLANRAKFRGLLHSLTAILYSIFFLRF